ncbi:MAG: hypothetical protein ACJ79W_05745 [Myxococcales bacterium]
MRRVVVLAAVAAFAAGPALAADVRVDGSYRFRVNLNSNYLLDPTTPLGQKTWIEHRLRLTPKIVEEGQIEIQASFDILSGLLAGDLAPGFQHLGYTERSERNGTRAQGFDFRHLFAKLRLPVGIFEIGQMSSDWGMGVLTQGGNQEEGPDFGDIRFGDIVDRALFAFRPLTFLGPRSRLARTVALAVAGDIIYRDRYASLVTTTGSNGFAWGDTAWRILSALVWDPSPDSRAGLYVSRRIQDYAAAGGDLHTWTIDFHARTLFPLESIGGIVSLETEALTIWGETSHGANLNSFTSAKVAQQGASARALLSRGRIEAEVEGGYASGDANPFDGNVTAFQFNRDYKVGMVLFDEVMLFQSQNAAQRLADPRLSGRPPIGIDLLPTEGAVTNAIYVKPTLRYNPPLFGSRFRLVGSAVFAWAAQLPTDPYQSMVTSAPRNVFGATPGKDYGVEVDASIAYRMKLAEPFGLELGAQGGHLFPGSAFLRPNGTTMAGATAAKLRATLSF